MARTSSLYDHLGGGGGGEGGGALECDFFIYKESKSKKKIWWLGEQRVGVWLW